MKKLIFTAIAAVLLFSSCIFEDEYYPEALVGTWVQTSNKGETLNGEKNGVLTLYFENNGYMYVEDAKSGDRPFYECDTWTYYMTKDSVLVIEYDYYDGDEHEYDICRLDMSFEDNDNTLNLVYDPLIGSAKYYTFMRR